MAKCAPAEINNLLQEFVRSFRDSFGEKLIGIYLHGSLAMGGFNPVSSDVDVLIVMREALSLDEKRTAGQILLHLASKAPSKGLEVSVISLESLRPFQHPTPYQVHFSNGNKEKYAQGTMDFTQEVTDGDLAAHVVITRARGICLYGEAIEDVFPEVPRKYYLDSIASDSEWSYQNIIRGSDSGEGSIPVYGVLNFCRVLAFIEQGLITSKSEGGRWGLEHLPQEYRPIIEEALKEYTVSGTSGKVDAKLLKQFARYANTRIAQANP